MNEVVALETTHNWEDLDNRQKDQVIAAHMPVTQFVQGSAKHKRELLLRLFELGRPKIVFGGAYCRVHADSSDVMKVITRQYLK